MLLRNRLLSEDNEELRPNPRGRSIAENVRQKTGIFAEAILSARNTLNDTCPLFSETLSGGEFCVALQIVVHLYNR